MATHSTFTAWAQSTDAEFRSWATEFDTAALATGLIAGTDTGQIDLLTVLKPAAGGNYQGFKMYRTNDGLTNLYVKVEFGASTGNALWPAIAVTVGTGTNGTGTLNSAGISARQITSSNTASVAGNVTTRACGITGMWWIAFKLGGQNVGAQAGGGFSLMRFCDANGVATSDGYLFATPSAASSALGAQQLRISGNILSSNSANFCLIPADISSSVVGTDIQFWKHYTAQPRMRVNPFMLSVDVNVAVDFTQRTMTPVGATAHNYISNGTSFMKSAGIGAVTTAHIPVMPWE